MTAFSEKDSALLAQKGISKEKVLAQIETFKEGIPYVSLERPAVVGDGIVRLTEHEEQRLISKYNKAREGLSLLKFVPASGAASRMFKALFNFLERYNPGSQPLERYLDNSPDKDLRIFFERRRELPFFDIVQKRIAGKTTSEDEECYLFVAEMLREDRLNYGFYPKGLLPFHKYEEHVATPFEEHLKEAASYAVSGDSARLHFTISEQHGELFNREFSAVKEQVSYETGTSFHLKYSFQKPCTDTIAVTLENEIFRDSEGNMLFRPGGHGALIENLAEQEADLIFIKNIDNVVVPEYLGAVADSKRILAGLLLEIQHQAFAYARQMNAGDLDSQKLEEIRSFLESRLNVRFSERFTGFSLDQQIHVLQDKINRPVRVCGMVRNEGEPGGGPYWIRDGKGNVSLQIVESAQVDLNGESQLKIFREATHFNPVDLVCGTRDHRGRNYKLLNYVDGKQGFITRKTLEGKTLKALELPGLWNGGMAFWNTLFVEVPSSTFNPVKTVTDLLKPAHQQP